MSLADALGSDHTFGVRDASQHEDVDMDDADLFGEDDGAAPPPTAATGLSDASPAPVLDEEEQRRQHLEYNEDEGEPDPDLEQKVEATVEIPDVPFPRSSDGKYWIIRLPNYLKLDARPFAPEVYNGVESEEGDVVNAKERSMSIKLEVENTIRWRWVRGPNGEMVRQSNTRFIRWSDGSLSLQLGKELFDVNQNVEPAAQAQQASQSSQPDSQPAHTSGSLTYLVAQHKRAEILQAEALVTGHLSVRPVSMQSEAHRRLVRALSQKHSKTARMILVDSAPMSEQGAAQAKARRAPRRPRDPDAQPSRRRSRMSRADVWSDDDDLGLDETLYGGGGDDGTPRKDRAKPKKRRRDDGEDHAEDYKTDDFVVADTSDEDDDSPGKKRKKKSRAHDDMDDAPDELEEMDKAIERRENERRKKAAAASKKAAAESAAAAPPPKVDDHQSEDMDVESEEEDDMPRVVRKPAPGKRKVAFEDEEDE